MILFRIDYANALYLGAGAAQISMLQSIQNMAARVLFDLPKYHPISANLRKLHWLPVHRHIEFKALCLVHKALYGGGARHMQSLFSMYIPVRPLRSADQGLVIVPKTKRVRCGCKRFSVQASKLRNTLPRSLKGISSRTSFRKELKTLLFALPYISVQRSSTHSAL